MLVKMNIPLIMLSPVKARNLRGVENGKGTFSEGFYGYHNIIVCGAEATRFEPQRAV